MPKSLGDKRNRVGGASDGEPDHIADLTQLYENFRDGETPRVRLNESHNERPWMDSEVRPYVPEAWIDRTKTDPIDKQVGVVGYEIPLNRHFYVYQPPRPLEEIEDDIRTLEREIVDEVGKVLRS